MATVQSVTLRPDIEADGQFSSTDLRIADGDITVSADLLSGIEALAGQTGAATASPPDKSLAGAALGFDIVVRVVPDVVPSSVFGDIRNGWRITWPSGATRTIYGRSTADVLTSPDTVAMDKAQTANAALLDALLNVPGSGGVGLQDPSDGSNVTRDNLQILAVTSRRVIR